MILNEAKKDVVVSNSFKTSGFKIQASAKAFEILSSNIYQNKVRAVIREISCNAYDAHVASGNPDPFVVHLPTWAESWFSVRDYGPGLDDSSIREIYTTYFFSTKTNSNDYIGALGLGSKSPFSIVDSFTVTSWHNGKKMTYSCFKDENGEPQIANLSSEDSNEPSGIEVMVCVNKSLEKEFEQEAIETFRWFKTLPIINNQRVLDKIFEINSKWLKNDICGIAKAGWNGRTYAVMGNVAYATSDEYRVQYHDCYINFDIGELSFDPGRENLSYDENTRKNLKNKIEKVIRELKETVLQRLRAETNSFKRSLMALEVHNVPGINEDQEFLNYLPQKLKSGQFKYYYYWSRGCSVHKSDTFTEKMEIFRYEPKYDLRIKDYVRKNRVKAAVLTDEQIKELDIPDDMVKSLSTLPKLQRTRTASVVDRNIYEFTENGLVKVTSLPSETKIYVEEKRGNYDICGSYGYSWRTINKLINSLKSFGMDIKLYSVKPCVSKTKAFKSENWVKLEDYVKENLDTSKLVIYNNHDWLDEMIEIGNLTKHKEFDYLLKIFKKYDSTQLENTRLIQNVFNIEPQDDDSIRNEVQRLVDKYPLLIGLSLWRLTNKEKSINEYLDLKGN